MTNTTPAGFTFDHHRAGEGLIEFACSTDQSAWPWLALPATNQIHLQALSYFASIETLHALDAVDPEKWTALTHLAWTYGPACAEISVKGVAEVIAEAGAPDMRLRFIDAQGASTFETTVKGVVFKTRDFAAWREKAKKDAEAVPAPEEFAFAPAEAVGVASPIESLVTEVFHTDGVAAVDALVSLANGFRPRTPGGEGHPYHDGSGDHVNSGHLGDAIQQAVRQFDERARASHPGIEGAIDFSRYIELGRPFRIKVNPEETDGRRLALDVSQLGHVCAHARLRFRNAG